MSKSQISGADSQSSTLSKPRSRLLSTFYAHSSFVVLIAMGLFCVALLATAFWLQSRPAQSQGLLAGEGPILLEDLREGLGSGSGSGSGLNLGSKIGAESDSESEPDSGAREKLVDFKTLIEGRFVLVNFWASWCQICRMETQVLEALEEHLETLSLPVGAVRFLGIASYDQAEKARMSDKFQRLGFEFYLDRQGEVSARFGIQGLPYTFLLDPEGRLIYRIKGPLRSEDVEKIGAMLQLGTARMAKASSGSVW